MTSRGEQIRDALAAAGHDVTLETAGGVDGRPGGETVTIDLGPDPERRPLSLAVTALHLGADELEHTRFLQILGPYPFSAEASQQSLAAQAASIISNAMALGVVAVAVDGTCLYRAVIPVPASSDLHPGWVAEVVGFAIDQMERYGDFLEGALAGKIRLETMPDLLTL